MVVLFCTVAATRTATPNISWIEMWFSWLSTIDWASSVRIPPPLYSGRKNFVNDAGFLSTGDAAIPGNAGLKDQVLALEWVQKNIASFGGNPDSVTLTGLSAGGASVHYHYLSPRSKGLFHRGFSQSGVALMPWALQEQAYNKAKILAISMGCPISPSRNLVECLQQRPVHQILTKTPLFFGFYFTPIAPFAPVIEKGGLNPFLTVSPYFAIVRGDVQDLPWVVSNVPDEGMFPGLCKLTVWSKNYAAHCAPVSQKTPF